jgi:hypothetical protein
VGCRGRWQVVGHRSRWRVVGHRRGQRINPKSLPVKGGKLGSVGLLARRHLGGRAWSGGLWAENTGTTNQKWWCHGFVNRSAIEVGVWRFVEGGEHEGAIRDSGSTSLPSFRSRNGGETLRAAIIHYMATSARLQ